MEKKRITVYGSIDYSVARLEDIISDLEEEYLYFTRKAIKKLQECKKKTKDNFKSLDKPDDIINYIDYFITIFQSFEYDINRLLAEMPDGIENTHIDIINQICVRYRHDEIHAVEFKREHIERSLKDESLRPLIDDIYSESRNLLVKNKNLGSLSKRLQTFIGSRSLRKEKIRPQERKPLRITPIMPFPAPKGTSWYDVSICFSSKEAAGLRAGGKSEARDFIGMGFMDNRNKRPDKLWQVLLLFGIHNGEISWEDLDLPTDINKNLKKHVHRLRHRLRQLFQIDDDPFEKYRKVKAYKSKFKIELLNESIL